MLSPYRKFSGPRGGSFIPTRRNLAGGSGPLRVTDGKIAGFTPRNAEEARVVQDLAKKYTDWHWSEKPTRVIRVTDKLVPHLQAIGRLEQFKIDGETIDFPKGCWIGFDPKHPHERIHLVVNPSMREKLRKGMKTQRDTVTLQALAERTGGTHVRYKLPNLQAVPLGVAHAVTYETTKGGDGWSHYVHDFGKEHSKGKRPILAVDVSGRMWLVGGSYTCPLAGITG